MDIRGACLPVSAFTSAASWPTVVVGNKKESLLFSCLSRILSNRISAALTARVKIQPFFSMASRMLPKTQQKGEAFLSIPKTCLTEKG